MAQLSPSVYVGDLSTEVNEAALFDTFRAIGNVVSVRVCTDIQTRKSLGYGYVNYQTPQEAERAIESLNGKLILGRPCRVARVQRDPTARKSGLNNIFVKNLPENVTESTLHVLFGKFGRITSIGLPRGADGKLRGYAYINYEKEAEAVKAVEASADQELEGQVLQVERYKNLSSEREAQKARFTNTFVRNLRTEVTTEKLREIFGSCGNITSCLARPSRDGRMTVAFIAFDSHEAAQKLVSTFDGAESPFALEGTKLAAARFMARKERQRENELRRLKRQQEYAQYSNLYVKNLDEAIDDAKLREMFEKYGEIVSVHVQRDAAGISREFGFVSFKERTAAEAAIAELNASTLYGTRPLFVCMAQRRDVRRAAIEESARKRAQQGTAPGLMPMGAGMMMPNALYGGAQRGAFPGGPGAAGMYGMPQMFGMPGARMPAFPGQMGQPMMARPTQPAVLSRPTAPPVTMQRDANLAAYLSSMTSEQQKNALGERLYHSISKSHPDFASKVTGMLLEMDNSEILHLLEQPALLDGKVREALDVLKRHTQS